MLLLPCAPTVACGFLCTGGETTVTIRGKGKGGRNQELALAAAIALESVEGVVLLSAGTDGTDGPTDAAGGIVDGNTAAVAKKMGVDLNDALANNDSYHALDKVRVFRR